MRGCEGGGEGVRAQPRGGPFPAARPGRGVALSILRSPGRRGGLGTGRPPPTGRCPGPPLLLPPPELRRSPAAPPAASFAGGGRRRRQQRGHPPHAAVRAAPGASPREPRAAPACPRSRAAPPLTPTWRLLPPPEWLPGLGFPAREPPIGRPPPESPTTGGRGRATGKRSQ